MSPGFSLFAVNWYPINLMWLLLVTDTTEAATASGAGGEGAGGGTGQRWQQPGSIPPAGQHQDQGNPSPLRITPQPLLVLPLNRVPLRSPGVGTGARSPMVRLACEAIPAAGQSLLSPSNWRWINFVLLKRASLHRATCCSRASFPGICQAALGPCGCSAWSNGSGRGCKSCSLNRTSSWVKEGRAAAGVCVGRCPQSSPWEGS